MWAGQKSSHGGVGIFIKEPLDQQIIEVKRVSSSLMWVKIVIETEIVTILSVYAPQAGESEEVKESFWTLLEDTIQGIPNNDKIIVGGDLNGHVGEKTEGFDKVHGNFGYGERNEEGLRILEWAESHNLCILNTFFKKDSEHLITYRSGPIASQIDYLIIRQVDRPSCANIKIIPGEACVTQHRLMIANVVIKKMKRHKRVFPAKIDLET